MAQNAIPQNSIDKKLQIQNEYVHPVMTPPSKITHRSTKNKATAVPSLKRLSHSNNNASLLGAHIDLKIESTATGSVAEMSVPNIKQIMKGISNPTRGRTK
jgi:hypothetical protein